MKIKLGLKAKIHFLLLNFCTLCLVALFTNKFGLDWLFGLLTWFRIGFDTWLAVGDCKGLLWFTLLFTLLSGISRIGLFANMPLPRMDGETIFRLGNCVCVCAICNSNKKQKVVSFEHLPCKELFWLFWKFCACPWFVGMLRSLFIG